MTHQPLKILHLTLKRKWFDMILSGEKKEEYRELKDYWAIRLGDPHAIVEHCGLEYKEFDIVRFTNGYGKNAPAMDVEFLETYAGIGKPEWGASGDAVFIILLGNILSTKNIK